MNLRAFQNLPILDQLSTLLGPTVAYRNIHFEPADFASFTNRILKNAGIPVSSKILDFLVPFRLTDLTQDIVVCQFDSNAFNEAYIVGVSV